MGHFNLVETGYSRPQSYDLIYSKSVFFSARIYFKILEFNHGKVCIKEYMYV